MVMGDLGLAQITCHDDLPRLTFVRLDETALAFLSMIFVCSLWVAGRGARSSSKEGDSPVCAHD